MEVRRKINPGDPGTHRLVEEYGNRLVCVRYRYDKTRHIRLTTVELIVYEHPWYESHRVTSKKSTRPAKEVYLRILYNELSLREKVKAAGGHWNQDKKLWQLPGKQVEKLGLGDRVVEG